MTLKERLDEIWNSKGVRCPSNTVLWSEHQYGYKYAFWNSNDQITLYYRKGKRVQLKIIRRKK